ncbi:uncharacterized protein LOC142101343 isoform X2 [Mixophyes fleayi]|uniref:uncharacterized protein LOC142101343 isoform X2 n=1 Tax=Mixophyes fleayi TaxID=3061075 RepID=UPI003F4E096A
MEPNGAPMGRRNRVQQTRRGEKACEVVGTSAETEPLWAGEIECNKQDVGRKHVRWLGPLQSINPAAKMKNPPVISPYMQRTITQRAAHKIPPDTLPAPTSRARAKTPCKSPYGISSCASAPAIATRSPAERLAASNPPPKTKRRTSAGVTRERHSVTVTQPDPRPMPYVLVPVRVKRTGLKLLDPEKVKNLTSAARSPASGGKRLNLIPHQTKGNKQPPVIRRQLRIPRSPMKQATSSRISGRREDTNQPTRNKTTRLDEDTDLLTQQIDGLVLGDKDCVGSTTCDNVQASDIPHQASFPAVGSQDNVSKSVETAQVDDHTDVDPCGDDQQKTSHLPTFPSMSAKNEETRGHCTSREVDSQSKYEQTDVHEQLPGENEEPQIVPSSCHSEENQKTEPTSPDHSLPSSSTIKVVGGLIYTSPEPEPSTGTLCQEVKPTSARSHPTTDTDSVGENCKSLPEKDLTQKSNVNLGQTSNPAEEDTAETASFQAKIYPPVWAGSNEVIRQRQGVLVLTRSTDEDAIFIPKLQFEFTPDNSIDWTAFHQPAANSTGGLNKRNDPGITKPCTPRGPSFSKSVLKKSSTLPNHGSISRGHPESPSAGEVTRNSRYPLYGIVDLSISFQGKFEDQEIPTDIPKILLTEEEIDED